MTRNARARYVRKWVLIFLLVAAGGAACGCRTIGFYAQAARGQYEVLVHRERIEKLVADPATPARLKTQLELVERLRAFARTELKLPVDAHYRDYTDVHRPCVVWNVQAAPRFSLQPVTWWYPLVGSLEYRGYFSERGARDYAAYLARKGYDVCTDGVEAYSTLGWFKDPVLNTFVYRDEPELAEVIFHELGHQRVFAPGDTDFNEAFATTVGQEGARRWLLAANETNLYDHYLVSLKRDRQFVQLVMNTRLRLEKIYGDTLDKDGNVKAAARLPAPPGEMEREKRAAFDDLRAEYDRLKAAWDGYDGYDDWFTHDLNNAKLNTIATYYDLVPGFKNLLKENGGDMEKFYQAVERLAKMPREERRQRLRDLARAGLVRSEISQGR